MHTQPRAVSNKLTRSAVVERAAQLFLPTGHVVMMTMQWFVTVSPSSRLDSHSIMPESDSSNLII
jgi:hypothetical protein